MQDIFVYNFGRKKMFRIKGIKKQDLMAVAEESEQDVDSGENMWVLKEIILKSREYIEEAEFVKHMLVNTIKERRERENSDYRN